MRRCCADGVPGLGIRPGERLEVTAAVDAFGTDVLVRREPGELYALRHDIAARRPLETPVEGWVERLDPETLAVTASTPRLPGGAYWPGGMAAHANGDLHMVFGRWIHRLTPDLEVLASHQLPVPRPHNSFQVLDGGELVLKDCDAPAGLEPSTVSVLDPRHADAGGAGAAAAGAVDRAARVGRRERDRRRHDHGVPGCGSTARPAGSRSTTGGSPPTGRRPGRSYGWDPVITDEHVLWMDNGRNHTDRTMVGTGEAPDPVRLWWARRDDDQAVRSVEISGLPFGTESNPPAWDPSSGVVIAYDAGNAVLRAWRLVGDDLEPLWRRDGFAHAGHLILYPDTRELVVQDWKDQAAMRRPLVRRTLQPILQVLSQSAAARRASLRTGSDQLVVLDLDTGEDKARCDVPSPSQAFLFPAPGLRPRRLLPVAHDHRARRGGLLSA